MSEQNMVVPNGWKAIPGEPTWETLIAGRDALMDTDDEIDLSTDQIREAYRAMFAISPPPALSGAPVGASEAGWLVELKGQAPSWSTLFAGDYDDHWTDDSTKALRFARKVDAESFIAWHGWTEAFASEHIWQDMRAGDRP